MRKRVLKAQVAAITAEHPRWPRCPLNQKRSEGLQISQRQRFDGFSVLSAACGEIRISVEAMRRWSQTPDDLEHGCPMDRRHAEALEDALLELGIGKRTRKDKPVKAKRRTWRDLCDGMEYTTAGVLHGEQ